MTLRAPFPWKPAGTALLLGTAAWLLAAQWYRAPAHDGSRVWFYDESEKRLYPMPVDTVPPDAGVGGARGDGDRAVVVAFDGRGSDPAKRRLAYLLRYTPELKQSLEAVAAAHAARRVPANPPPDRNSDYFRQNTLVRLPDDSEWHPAGTPEARLAMDAWRSWRGPGGEPPMVCTP